MKTKMFKSGISLLFSIIFSFASCNMGDNLIILFDEPPNFSLGFDLVSIASNNPDYSRAKSGDLITLSFFTTETMSTPTVTIAGNAAPVTGGPTVWSAAYTMAPADAEGTIPFIISNIVDANGNSYPDVSSTTNGTSVLYDRTAPSITLVGISSTNADTSKAKVGDTVTVYFTSNEPLKIPTVNIAGNPVSLSGGPLVWTASHVMTAGDPDGIVIFDISSISDLAGNTIADISSSTDGTSVTFDKTGPSLNIVSITSSNADPSWAKVGDVITLAFTADEATIIPTVTISGNAAAVAGGPLAWTATYAMTAGDPEGPVGFIISNIEDIVGNASPNVSSTTDASFVIFDKTPPSLSFVSISSSNADISRAKVGDLITVLFTSSEDIMIPTVTIAGNAAAVTGGPASWSATYTMTAGDSEGPVAFLISGIEDLTGNASPNVSSTTDASSVTFDKTAPVVAPVSITSNNGDPSLAAPGDTITLNFDSDEDIMIPTVTIAGNAAAVIGGPAAWIAEYTMTGTEAEGLVSFNISNISDLAGNTAADISATTDGTSVVFDKGGPVISPVSISSNNADPSKAKVGDVITLAFTADEATIIPTVTISGSAATVTGGPFGWTATYAMTAGDPEGPVGFVISNIEDIAGNASPNVSSTTDASFVIFDKTPPSLSFVSISSSNADISRAKVGDLITVLFTSSEDIMIPTVTIAGNAAAVTGGPASWSATYTMTAGDSEGPVAFLISGIEDLTGNASPNVSSTTDASSVTFDKTAPVVAPVSITSNNGDPSLAAPGDTITLNFDSDEDIMIPTVTIAGNAAAVVGGPTAWIAEYTMSGTEAEGLVSFNISNIFDLAGNTAADISATTDGTSVVFDKGGPVISPVSISSNNADPSKAKVGDVITLAFTADEATIIPTVTISGSAATVTGGPFGWTATYAMTAGDPEGPVGFVISNIEDIAGNASPNVSSTTDASFVIFDKTPPSLSFVSISSSNADISRAKVGDLITVLFTSSEDIMIPTVTIAGNAAAVTGGPASWSATYTMTAGDSEGPVAFLISGIEDLTGNASPNVSSTTDASSVTFDKTAPVVAPVSITSNNGDPSLAAPGDTITLNFDSDEDIMIPTVTIAGNAAAVVGGPTAWIAEYTMSGTEAEGLVSFNISNIFDLAGNTAADISATTDGTSVVFDKGGPVISPVSISSNNADPSKAKVGDIIELIFTADEAIIIPTVTISGSAATVTGGPLAWTTTYAMTAGDPEGPVGFVISNIEDIAGNVSPNVSSTTDASFVIFDKTAPSISSVSISSSNADISRAKVGDLITVLFTSSEAIVIPTVTIAGNAAAVTGGPVSWTATYTMTAGDSEGPVAFLISGIEDLTGNASPNVSSTTDASSVTFDRTPPVITPVSITSNNGDPSLAGIGDTITLDFDSDEDIMIPTVTIAGNAAAVSGGPAAWIAEYTMSGTEAEGLISFNISNLSDLAGNTVADISTTTDGTSVVFDKGGPVISPVSISSNNADPSKAKVGDIIELIFTADEAIIIPAVTISGSAVTVTGGPLAWTATYAMTAGDPEGPVGFVISNIEDIAGNGSPNVSSTTDASFVIFDKTAPSISSVSISSSNADISRAKVSDLITVLFTSSEDIMIPTVTIAGNAAAVTGGPASWTATYTMTAGDSEGPVAFLISGIEDLTGNASPNVSSTTDASSVTFDKTAPVITPVLIASDNGDPSLAIPGDTITLSFSSDEDIIIPTVTIAGNAAAVAGGPIVWTAEYTMTGTEASGLIPFLISNISDLTGNTASNISSTTDASSVTFDKTSPVIPTVSIVSSNSVDTLAKPGDDVTLVFIASESILTPTVTIAGNAAVVSAGPILWQATYTMTAASPDGVIPFLISGIEDIAGNTSPNVSATTDGSSVTFDKTNPAINTVTIVSSNSINTLAKPGDDVSLVFIASEPINTPTVTIDGNAAVVSVGPIIWNATYTMTAASPDGVIPFLISGIEDIAGNTSPNVSATTDGSSVTFDKTPPSVSYVSIASTNADPSVADAGDEIIVTFTLNEAMKTPSATILGNAATIAGGPVNWTASYTTTANEPEGTVPFNITNLSDLAGNAMADISATTDASSVYFRLYWELEVKTTAINQVMSISLVSPVNVYIKWGDGTDDLTNLTSISHTYVVPGNYTLSIRGQAARIHFDNANAQARLTGILSVVRGITGLTSFEFTFLGCSNISGNIPTGLFDNAANVINFQGTFFNCSGLTGTIPPDLFANNTLAQTFWDVFFGCSGLSGTIPGNLFANNPDAENFQSAFFGCSGLTGPLPSNLFAGNPGALTFKDTFYNCTSLNGSIPANFFANNTFVQNFQGTFHDCNNLIGSIPSNLFANNSDAVTFQGTFLGCTGLTGSIPGALFANCPVVTSFLQTFNGCTGLTGPIPAGLFDANTAVQIFRAVFMDCTGISETVPANLFQFNTSVVTFEEAFMNCTGITGTVPELWVNTAIKFPALTIWMNCFNGAINASNFGAIDPAWK